MAPKLISDVYEEGPKYLRDMDILANKYGFDVTYFNSVDMLTYEQFIVIVGESIHSGASSIAAVGLVVFIFTGSPRLALLTII